MKPVSALLGALLVSAAASAPAATEHVVVNYSTSELASVEGITAVNERIEKAAREFCAEHLHGTYGIARRSSCERAVVDDIVDSIDDARLTAYVRTGEVPASLLAQR